MKNEWLKNADAIPRHLILEGVVVTELLTQWIPRLKELMPIASEGQVDQMEEVIVKAYKENIENKFNEAKASDSEIACRAYTTILQKLDRYPNY